VLRIVVASTTAPAASVGPSPPSVPTLVKTTLRRLKVSKLRAADNANSWLRPPLPLFGGSETVLSAETEKFAIDK